MKTLTLAAICLAVSGCVQHHMPTLGESCGHLTGAEFQMCAHDLGVENDIRMENRARLPSFSSPPLPPSTIHSYTSVATPSQPPPMPQAQPEPPTPKPQEPQRPQFIPYREVAPLMPGIRPDGTAQ